MFLPTPKEPSFFCEPFQVIRTPIRYAALFEGAVGGHGRRRRQPRVPDPSGRGPYIKAFLPDARFVLIFRHPADRALAMYSYMLENGYEHHRTFEARARGRGRPVPQRAVRPEHCPHSFWNFMYFRSGLFGEQVARYLDEYPRDRFYFTTLYDLQADPNRVLGDVEEFIGVTRRRPRRARAVRVEQGRQVDPRCNCSSAWSCASSPAATCPSWPTPAAASTRGTAATDRPCGPDRVPRSKPGTSPTSNASAELTGVDVLDAHRRARGGA